MLQSGLRTAKLTPELRALHEAASAPAPALLFKPEPNRAWSIQLRRKVDDLSFVLNLLATVTLIGLPLLAPRDNAGTHVREQPQDMTPVREGSSVARTSAHPGLLATASQKGYVNEPLPLGIWLNDASGEETVTIGGLAEDTLLSQGSSRGWAGWLLAARDLDKTFVGPPKDFVGVMDATVKLSSAGGQLLESQVIRFEWIAKTEDVLPPTLEPPEPAQVVQSLNAGQIAKSLRHPIGSERLGRASYRAQVPRGHYRPALIKVGEDLLQQGDIAATPTVLKRAATVARRMWPTHKRRVATLLHFLRAKGE
jgi:hypothetical protein